jgi:hypothetical protein
MKLFELRRTEDESGISGTGTVAQGVIFDNGTCVLTWLTEHTSVAVYASIDTVVKIHGHEGKTRIVQIADCDKRSIREHTRLVATLQDDDPQPPIRLDARLYLWTTVGDKFVELFDEKEIEADEHEQPRDS